MTSILAPKFADLGNLSASREILSFQLGWLGEVVILTRDVSDTTEFHYAIHRVGNFGFEHHYAPPTSDSWMTALSLPDNRWCVIGDFLDESSYSTRVFDRNFQPLSTFWHAGAKHIRATEKKLWIGCSDAHIAGDLGEPMESGLFSIDFDGNVLFQYSEVVEAGMAPRIDDCSALNVEDDNSVWAYYFGEYPLVHLRNNAVQRVCQNIPVLLADSVAISDATALFAGGAYINDSFGDRYSADEHADEIDKQRSNVLHAVDISGPEAQYICQVHLVDERGESVFPGDYVRFGWGSHLVLCSNRDIRTVFVDASLRDAHDELRIKQRGE